MAHGPRRRNAGLRLSSQPYGRSEDVEMIRPSEESSGGLLGGIARGVQGGMSFIKKILFGGAPTLAPPPATPTAAGFPGSTPRQEAEKRATTQQSNAPGTYARISDGSNTWRSQKPSSLRDLSPRATSPARGGWGRLSARPVRDSPLGNASMFEFGDRKRKGLEEEGSQMRRGQGLMSQSVLAGAYSVPASPGGDSKRRQTSAHWGGVNLSGTAPASDVSLIPRFVDVLRREPYHSRASDTARSILSTLDKIPGGGSVGSFRPPQPLRKVSAALLAPPVRGAGRSLADMLGVRKNGAAQGEMAPLPSPALSYSAVSALPAVPAVQAIPTVPSFSSFLPAAAPASIPAAAPASTAAAAPTPVAVSAPAPAANNAHNFAALSSILTAAAKPVKPVTPSSPMKKAESPKKVVSPNKRLLSAAPAPAPVPAPVPAAPAAPASGGFVWGDPSKVSDADFIDNNCFAPGAESGGSDSEKEEPVKKVEPKTDSSSIFGGSIFGSSASIFGNSSTGSTSIFGGPASTGVSSIFGAASGGSGGSGGAVSNIFGGASSSSGASIFNQVPAFGKSTEPAKPAEPVKPTESIFGSQNSLFGSGSGAPLFGSSAPAEGTAPIFGAAPKSETPAFGSSTTSVFGAPASAAPSFGAASSSFTTRAPPAFGASPATSSLFSSSGSQAFGATSSAATGSAPAFGSTGPAPAFGATAAFGATQAPAAPAFGANTAAFGASTAPGFGATAAPAFGATPAFGASVFGGMDTGSGVFGGANSGGSVFGGASFGGQSSASPAPLFGAVTNQTPLFGQPQPGTPTGSAFGRTETPNSGVFGVTQRGPSPFSGQPSPFGGSDNVFALGDDSGRRSSLDGRKIIRAKRRN